MGGLVATAVLGAVSSERSGARATGQSSVKEASGWTEGLCERVCVCACVCVCECSERRGSSTAQRRASKVRLGSDWGKTASASVSVGEGEIRLDRLKAQAGGPAAVLARGLLEPSGHLRLGADHARQGCQGQSQ